MPLIITQGYGQLDNGFSAPALTVGVNYSDLVFAEALDSLILEAAQTQYWRIETVSDIKMTVTAVEIVSGTTIRIHHTEGHGGDVHTLYLPANGIRSLGGTVYNGPGSFVFTAVGQAPNFTILQSIDVRQVRVIFNESVDDAALVPANYSLTPTLRIYAVQRINERTVVLTTDPQTPGTLYTLEAVNIGDLSLNTVV